MSGVLVINVAALLLLALLACHSSPLPHHVNGSTLNQPSFKAVLSHDLKLSSFSDVHVNGESAGQPQTKEGLGPVAAAEHIPVNPFLREKRQTSCSMESHIPEMISDLTTTLNSTQFIGLDPAGWTAPEPIQQDGNLECPDDGSRPHWWGTHSKRNLLSICPWTYTQKNLSEDYFPRSVPEANCLCRKCIGTTATGCDRFMQKMTFFKREGCKNGLALMNKVTLDIAVGCYCATPQIQRPSDPLSE